MEQQKTSVNAYVLAAWFIVLSPMLAALYLSGCGGFFMDWLGVTWGMFALLLPLVFLGPFVMSGITYAFWIRKVDKGTGFMHSLKAHVAVHRPLGILPLVASGILVFFALAAAYKETDVPGHTEVGIILMVVNAAFAVFGLRRALQGARALVALIEQHKKDAP